MLTFQLSEYRVHALAFSPDSVRLAAACGRNLAVFDWQVPGEPVWYLPPNAPMRATSLAFTPDGSVVLASTDGRGISNYDLSTGGIVETLPRTGPTHIIWAGYSPVVVAGADPPAVLAFGYLSLPGPAQVFVLSPAGGPPVARLNRFLERDPERAVRPDDRPRAAWVDGQDRLLVWSRGFLRWFRWPPPPPAAPPSRWRALASALTGSRPAPPHLELLAEHPFQFTAAEAVAPLPDGATVLIAARGALVRWHAPTSTKVARWRWPGVQSLHSLAVSPDGTVAAVGGNSGRVIVWDLDV